MPITGYSGRCVYFAGLLLVSGLAYGESEHTFSGKATALASYSDAITVADMSRLEGDDGFDLNGRLQLSYEYTNGNYGLFAHGRVTSEGKGRHGKVGMIELYGYYLSELDEQQTFTYSLGQMFLPSSLENTEDFWDSPYSNNFSALNSWIGAEVRPIGFELRYDFLQEDDGFNAFGVTAMSFLGNDSMASQLTWRGWSVGRHKSAYGEIVDLPPLAQIQSGMFSVQRDDGSKPFGRDLDYKYGWTVHGYWSPTQNLTLKATWLDNGGSGTLYRGEYAWTNRFNILGIDWRPHTDWTVLFETMNGYAAMGNPPVAGVSVEHQTSYLLVSYNHQQWDYTVRLEKFKGVDTTVLPGESNDRGRALTLSTRWQAFGEPWSVIAEYLHIDAAGDRVRALPVGTFVDDDETQFSVSLNYFF